MLLPSDSSLEPSGTHVANEDDSDHPELASVKPTTTVTGDATEIEQPCTVDDQGWEELFEKEVDTDPTFPKHWKLFGGTHDQQKVPC